MSNVLAIAHKELKGYFASPIAYIVIGFSAILFGWFFINLLYYFDRMALQAGTWRRVGSGLGALSTQPMWTAARRFPMPRPRRACG